MDIIYLNVYLIKCDAPEVYLNQIDLSLKNYYRVM